MGPRPGDFPLGSLESRAAARAVQLARELEIQERQAAQLQNLTPLEQEISEASDDPEVQALMVRLFRYTVIPRYEIYGMQLPTAEELRQLRKDSSARNRQT
jgi:hypothetical protein